MAARWQLGLGRENGLIFWAMVFLEACFGSFFALWPLWIEELGAPIALVGLLIGLGGILRLFALAPSAWLARRFGVKRVILVTRSIATVGIASAALAPEWWWLLPPLIGMAFGDVAFPLVSTMISANAGAQRVRAFAIILTAGPSISLMLTPLLSGGLVALWGMRAPYISAALFSLVSLYFFSKISPVRVASDDGAQPAARYADLLAVRGLPLLMTLQFLTFFALGIGTSLISNYLHDEAGYAESRIAMLTSMTAVGSILFGTAVARGTRLAGAPLRAVALAAGFACAAYVLFLTPGQLPLVLVAMTLRGGFFAAWPLYAAVLGEAAGERLRPHAFAMGEILAGTGFIVSPVVAGQLFDISPRLPLIVSIVMLVPLVAVLARVRVPRHDEPPVPGQQFATAQS